MAHQRNDTAISISDTLTDSPRASAFNKTQINRQFSSDSTTSDDSLSDYAEDPSVVPPKHPFRTLVLCFDGTGDQFDLDVNDFPLTPPQRGSDHIDFLELEHCQILSNATDRRS
ncbi:hypothetical protein K435DRAFT_864290 [Dendrothele bispora CBS 962.96]|uniref:DUF2235 domain-containing protein n=1 Tax=Dendrothele bispora (strain CBS 962.96) TaxID=1314807 RepID=A0A4S8LM91_DENBC|nr:hypothetical protein K435DRAFT_864290 [Dendrothele bispora CBS 962.96]